MKKSILFLLFMLSVILNAQQTLTIPYQALVRDASGNPVTNQSIRARITLLQDSFTGLEIFNEEQVKTTNQFGQLELEIGSVNTTAFDSIDWSSGKMFIKLEVDITGGTAYQEIATVPLLAVPFAKYAEEAAGWKKTDGGICFLQGKVGIGTDTLLSSSTNLQIAMNDPIFGGLRITNTDPTENNQALFRIDASSNKGNAFRIQRDGKIGINVSNPTTLLQIKGNSIPDFTGITRGVFTLSADYLPNYYTSIDFLYTQGSNPTARIAAKHTSNGSKLVFGTSDTYAFGITNTAMTISNNGNVGIGTENPITNLHVYGGSSGQSPTNIGGIFVENNGVSNTSYVFQTATSGGGKSLSVTNAGNVGIGTATPTRNLHVKDVLRLEPRSTAPSSPAKGDIYFDSDDNILKVWNGSTWKNCY